MVSTSPNLIETSLLSLSNEAGGILLEPQDTRAAVFPLAKPPASHNAGISKPPKLVKAGSRLRSTPRDLVPPGPWFAQAVRDRWKSYSERLAECRQEPSMESVHQVRVATRRLASQLILLGCIAPGRRTRKARRMLKRQLKALGPLRDVHIQRIFIDQ